MNRKGKRKGKGKGKSNKQSTVKKPPWLELPEGIWANILQRLGTYEILETAERVCTSWRRICKDPSMWRVINISNEWDPSEMPDLEKVCRHAVKRSRGELVDIHMEYFATDDLLIYIAARSRKLKRLSIASCYGMVCDGLVKAVRKLPLLEELSLTHTDITKKGIEAVGRCCPLLKSFEVNNSCYMDFDEEDRRNKEALTIARNLSTLQHLQLIANSMTNEGLQAILDGCPNLVSLDLRQCTNINLEVLDKVLSSRISQIKDVKYPHDSMEGFPFVFEPWGNEVYEHNMSSDDDIIGMYDDEIIDVYGDYYFGF